MEGDTIPSVFNPLVSKVIRSKYGGADTTTMSDDLGSSAIGKPLADSMVQATVAGIDYKLYVKDAANRFPLSLEKQLSNIITAGVKAIRNGTIQEGNLNESVRRILLNKNQLTNACSS